MNKEQILELAIESGALSTSATTMQFSDGQVIAFAAALTAPLEQELAELRRTLDTLQEVIVKQVGRIAELKAENATEFKHTLADRCEELENANLKQHDRIDELDRASDQWRGLYVGAMLRNANLVKTNMRIAELEAHEQQMLTLNFNVSQAQSKRIHELESALAIAAAIRDEKDREIEGLTVEQQVADTSIAQLTEMNRKLVAYTAKLNMKIADLKSDLAKACEIATQIQNEALQREDEILAVSPEVVAWEMVCDSGTKHILTEEMQAIKFGQYVDRDVYPLGRIVPVKPMTAKELIVLLEKHHGYGSGWAAFARDVEAHHGIGSKV